MKTEYCSACNLRDKVLNHRPEAELLRFYWPVDFIFTGLIGIFLAWAGGPEVKDEDCFCFIVLWFSSKMEGSKSKTQYAKAHLTPYIEV